MDRLEVGVQEYMAEQSQGDKSREGTPSGGEQEKGMGDKVSNTSTEAAPAPSEAGHLSSAKRVFL